MTPNRLMKLVIEVLRVTSSHPLPDDWHRPGHPLDFALKCALNMARWTWLMCSLVLADFLLLFTSKYKVYGRAKRCFEGMRGSFGEKMGQ